MLLKNIDAYPSHTTPGFAQVSKSGVNRTTQEFCTIEVFGMNHRDTEAQPTLCLRVSVVQCLLGKKFMLN
jgi:hypothetical protein